MLVISGVNGSAADVDQKVNALLGICLPESVERGQIIDISTKYFEANPAKRHLPARSLIRDALVEAFPCK